LNIDDESLEAALRAIPPILGQDDWPDLRRRLVARRTIRTPLRRRRPTQRLAGACLHVLLAVGLWQTLQGHRSVVASGLELRTWTSAHQEAVKQAPLGDPWTQALAETTP
jgi:hypothetical protein